MTRVRNRHRSRSRIGQRWAVVGAGLTTKIHLVGDQDCRPMARVVIYKTRDTVERTINRLRGYRAVATRYDKREFMYRETIDVATIGIWLR